MCAPALQRATPDQRSALFTDNSTARTAQCAFRGATIARLSALLTGHSTARTAQCVHLGATARRGALQHPSNAQCARKHYRHCGSAPQDSMGLSSAAHARHSAHTPQVPSGCWTGGLQHGAR